MYVFIRRYFWRVILVIQTKYVKNYIFRRVYVCMGKWEKARCLITQRLEQKVTH